MHETDTQGSDLTVPQLIRARWGSDLPLEGLLARFAEPGWSYQELLPRACPDCGEALHSLRRPYESGGRQYRYVAVVCPACPRTFTLADLGVKTYDKLLRAAAPVQAEPAAPAPRRRGRTAAPSVSVRTAARLIAGLDSGPCPTGPGVTVTPVRLPRPACEPAPTAHSSSPAGPAAPAWPEDLPLPAEKETRALWWGKITNPSWVPPVQMLRAAEDARVIVSAGERFDELREVLSGFGARVRAAAHWVEEEVVTTLSDLGARVELAAWPGGGQSPVTGLAAYAARDAFAAQWDALDELPDTGTEAFTPVEDLVAADWKVLLPHPSFNPVQAATVPAVTEGDEHVIVVAPTGAGKTAIGMVAALTAHRAGRKAAWLVPQRSLTDELDRDLATWRKAGLRVVRLTGEAAVDNDLIRDADLWVATTEKFEAICRAGSLRTALAEVGCLVVDEIHLLGDPVRGPVLEALLARVREDAARVRIVGLSATVANADQVATWLGARLIRSPWRPTRLTWQLPAMPPEADAADWTTRTNTRTRRTVDLARHHTADGGSVLVFCGRKRSVRTTALALAQDRGVDTTGADADDSDLVERLCTKAGVRLHYRDWPHKCDAEHAFRTRQADILVATSTVAAGVNLPARAVIVRDTQIGMSRIEVSMVQQMFGRAGRIGAGEREGHAYLLTAPSERHHWQARLAAGYTVTSRIRDRLPDHLLAEAVQNRIATLTQAETWWKSTFAFHQGHHPFDPLHDATDFLTDTAYLTRTPTPGAEGDDRLEATELGRLTSRFMVDADLASTLADATTHLPVPTDPDTAENTLITTLATRLPILEQAPFTDRAKAELYNVLRTLARPGTGTDLDGQDQEDEEEEERQPVAGDLARAVLLLVAYAPRACRGRPAYIRGIPADSMAPVLDDAQRYLAWLGAQGPLATVHPWIAITAADLAQRIRWRTLAPARGAGRLLWMCEQMATPAHTHQLVPGMWQAARARGIDAPDWPGTTPPSTCRLSPAEYRALLGTRTTGTAITLHPDRAHISAPRSATVITWNGTATERHTGTGTVLDVPYPAPRPDGPSAGRTGAAVFTRGDRTAAGWAIAYNSAN
ncbi:DEAD/DEAH box helicase [Kitasatospora purpeofusca]|uniref:DEAD/DEAH box helicase n=1 Tax=Kitasatospora purpeofusca TaxID=67352 RepID=UPI002E0E10B5|nr:DEAD/DEAH box helicase [Kitasatospora purpeofusca]WSR37662.1 DEAD/DEAH box helicase [Kitasatospora purpeofusca]